MRWRIRPRTAGVGGTLVERLWQAAMPPSWPVLAADIAQIGEGLVAEAGSDPVGFAAVDMAGRIPLILVHPACQRRGIGTSLLAAALERIRAGGVTSVTAASGGGSYIWPGVPEDLPAAVQFFASRGWRRSHDTLDLVTDLARYRPPPGARDRAASTGDHGDPGGRADLADVLVFEAAAFPSWLRWFSAPGRDVLIARDSAGNIVGTLLLDGPGADTVFARHEAEACSRHRGRPAGSGQPVPACIRSACRSSVQMSGKHRGGYNFRDKGGKDGGSSGCEQVCAQASSGRGRPATGVPGECVRYPASRAGMSASMGSASASLSFRRIVDVPFETCVVAFDSWQRTGQGREMRSGAGQVLGPMEHDRDSGTRRIEVRVARGPLRPPRRMRLHLDRWSSSATALELIPCGRVRPTVAYFRAGHLLLDLLTRSLSQRLPPAHAQDTASQAHVSVGSARP